MDITRTYDQFRTTSHQQRRRWKTIKVRRLQVQIEAQLLMQPFPYIEFVVQREEREIFSIEIEKNYQAVVLY